MAWGGGTRRLQWGSAQQRASENMAPASGHGFPRTQTQATGRSGRDSNGGASNWRDTIKADRSVAERPKWQLTCYGHEREGPNDLPGDISPEEVRWANMQRANQGQTSLQQLASEFKAAEYAKRDQFQALTRAHRPPSLGGPPIFPPKVTICGLDWLVSGTKLGGADTNSQSIPFAGEAVGTAATFSEARGEFASSTPSTSFSAFQPLENGQEPSLNPFGQPGGFGRGFGSGAVSAGNSAQTGTMEFGDGPMGSSFESKVPPVGFGDKSVGPSSSDVAGFGAPFGASSPAPRFGTGGSFPSSFGKPETSVVFGHRSIESRSHNQHTQKFTAFPSQSTMPQQVPANSGFGFGTMQSSFSFHEAAGSSGQLFGHVGNQDGADATQNQKDSSLHPRVAGSQSISNAHPPSCDEKEAEIWRASEFKRGEIPETPPPREFC